MADEWWWSEWGGAAAGAAVSGNPGCRAVAVPAAALLADGAGGVR